MANQQVPPPRPRNSPSTPPIPDNRDQAVSVTGWTALAVALLILLLLLLIIWLLTTAMDGPAGAGDGRDLADSPTASGGAGVPESGTPGSKAIDSADKSGQPANASSDGLGGASSVAAGQAKGSSAGSKSGSDEDSESDAASVFSSSGSTGSPVQIPSGTIALGNITGTAEFFGVQSGAGPVAYVIDNSGSMGGYPFELARSKLKESVFAIRTGQKFSVFIYNHTFSGFKDGRLSVVSDNKKREFGQWIDSFYAGGNTLPVPPVEAAIKSGAKTIFLLTDGVFTDQDADQIVELCSKKGVVVHTYSLSSHSATLLRISKGCGGQFKFITP